jgi:hypothetical protein
MYLCLDHASTYWKIGVRRQNNMTVRPGGADHWRSQHCHSYLDSGFPEESRIFTKDQDPAYLKQITDHQPYRKIVSPNHAPTPPRYPAYWPLLLKQRLFREKAYAGPQ